METWTWTVIDTATWVISVASLEYSAECKDRCSWKQNKWRDSCPPLFCREIYRWRVWSPSSPQGKPSGQIQWTSETSQWLVVGTELCHGHCLWPVIRLAEVVGTELCHGHCLFRTVILYMDGWQCIGQMEMVIPVLLFRFKAESGHWKGRKANSAGCVADFRGRKDYSQSLPCLSWFFLLHMKQFDVAEKQQRTNQMSAGRGR